MAASSFPMRRYWIALDVLVALTGLPFLVSTAANGLLEINNCAFDLKGGTHCSIGGNDWGPVLGSTYLWALAFAATALWVSIAGLLIWVAVLVANRIRWKARGATRAAS